MVTAAPLVGVIMGSDSDLPTMKEAIAVLEVFQISHEVTIVSAHRTPEKMFEYGKNAHLRGIKVIIAGAGGAAHLPGIFNPLTRDWSSRSHAHFTRVRLSLFNCTDARRHSRGHGGDR